MANTYTQIYIQVVFAVQGRQCLIQPDHNEEIYKYITGIVTNQGQKMLQINGVADHVHLLIGMKPNIALSDLVRDVKAGSSKFINERRWIKGRFNWQEGFGAFSYGHSQLDQVIRYIRNQEKHHQQNSFKNEYLMLLRKFDVAFEDKYVFDFIEDEPLSKAEAGSDIEASRVITGSVGAECL
jgi:REP element-mobilizing transposase RayT